MVNDNLKDDELSRISWHPAFVEAIQLELDDYHDCLEFYPEYQLSSEPLKIDCVIIKKAKDVEIKKNIAAIFREANLLEYKSPDDYISVSDFYKAYGYTCLYASFEKLEITCLTISFVVSRYPQKLLKHFENVRHYEVEENSPGIYTVRGDIIPIQVIESRRLSADENLWLKNLSNRLNQFSVMQVNDRVIRLDKTARVQAYIYVIAKANSLVIEEALNMSKPAVSLEEVLERTGVTARAEARGEARGKEIEAIAIAQNLVNMGIPFETVVSATKLDLEKVKTMYNR